MATVNAPTLARPAYSGAAPLAAAHGKFTFAAHPIATRVRLFKLPAGTTITDFRLTFENLGAGSTIALGTETVSGLAFAGTLMTAASTAAAGNARMGNGAPLLLDEDTYVTATVGGAAATGALNVVAQYMPDGV